MRLQLPPELKYYDTVTLRHKDTKVLLHSHPERYPLRYDDGRISSQGMARASDYLYDAHV